MSKKSIKLLTSVVGDGFSYAAGELVEAPEFIANDLVKAGHAVFNGTAQKSENTQSKKVSAAEKR